MLSCIKDLSNRKIGKRIARDDRITIFLEYFQVALDAAIVVIYFLELCIPLQKFPTPCHAFKYLHYFYAGVMQVVHRRIDGSRLPADDLVAVFRSLQYQLHELNKRMDGMIQAQQNVQRKIEHIQVCIISFQTQYQVSTCIKSHGMLA